MTPTTNIEAWRIVRDGIADGMSPGRIAARYGLSIKLVYNWARMSEPPRSRVLGSTRGASAAKPSARCAECGAVAVTNGVERCSACITAERAAVAESRVAMLTDHAERTGVVPTVIESMAVLELGRSQSAAVMLAAFGPASSPRGQGRRSWPPA